MPPEEEIPSVATSDELTTCDFTRAATYVLGPQAMDVQLTHVETLKSPTSEFYVVRVTMTQQSTAAFTAYTAEHVSSQVAFIRDGAVVFAPKIAQIINSERLEISGDLTAEQADQITRQLRKPA
jgi:preprotein translocase subunit SecD